MAKRNYVEVKNGEEVKSTSSKKLCETLTVIRHLLSNANNSDSEVTQKLFENHLQQCANDYCNYVNNYVVKGKGNTDDYLRYLIRFTETYILTYELDNACIRECLYNNLQVADILKELNVEDLEFTTGISKVKVHVYSNGLFFSCENLEG